MVTWAPDLVEWQDIDSLADFGITVGIAAIFAANTYVGMNTFNHLLYSLQVIQHTMKLDLHDDSASF